MYSVGDAVPLVCHLCQQSLNVRVAGVFAASGIDVPHDADHASYPLSCSCGAEYNWLYWEYAVASYQRGVTVNGIVALTRAATPATATVAATAWTAAAKRCRSTRLFQIRPGECPLNDRQEAWRW